MRIGDEFSGQPHSSKESPSPKELASRRRNLLRVDKNLARARNPALNKNSRLRPFSGNDSLDTSQIGLKQETSFTNMSPTKTDSEYWKPDIVNYSETWNSPALPRHADNTNSTKVFSEVFMSPQENSKLKSDVKTPDKVNWNFYDPPTPKGRADENDNSTRPPGTPDVKAKRYSDFMHNPNLNKSVEPET
jgi:hypothetical protein